MNIKTQFAELKQVIREAGEEARAYFAADSFANELKPDGTVVTEVDQKIETALLSYIRKTFPHDAIVGEEHGSREGTSGFVWHLDPIDGTDNFLRKIPFCAVSVARLGPTAEDSLGIVYNPLTDQLFASLMEDAVYENERIAQFTADTLGNNFVISIGRGQEPWMKPASYELIKGLGNEFGRCKTYGSTALELAYVAANRIDAFLTFGLNSYDYAAGLFLIRAAGGAISVHGEDGWERYEGALRELCCEHGKTIFVSHPEVHDRVRDFIGDPRQWEKM